ncbi:MAG: long-chain fatty acid--CoA ligase [bacterium]|nr:long-chain fatty acid--CoA ligase [bacterium]
MPAPSTPTSPSANSSGVTPAKQQISKEHINEGIRATTMPVLYREAAAVWGRRPAFARRTKSTGAKDKIAVWQPTGFDSLYAEGAALAAALVELGIAAKDRIGMLADNRIEWIIANYGIQLAGCADVPRGADVTPADVTFILPHAGATACFVETLDLWKRIEPVKNEMPNVRHWILMDSAKTAPEGMLHMNDLIARGHSLRESGDRSAEERTNGVKPEDLCTLIYTSGTTGAPKGVMLSHSNILYALDLMPIDLSPNDRILSILPVWHIFERVFEVLAISRGICTYYSSVRFLSEDFKNVQPTFMGSAPRLWESLYVRIIEGIGKAHIVRRILFHSAYKLATMYRGSLNFILKNNLQLTKPNPLVYAIGAVFHAIRWVLIVPIYGFFNVAVLERLRQGLGASLRGTVSGGGSLPKHVDDFFNNVGIPVLEGYGLTETSGPLTARGPQNLVVGTVGPPLAGTELRIIDINTGELLYPNSARPDMGRGLKGEIHARGPQIMKAYHDNEEATSKVFDQHGYFNTGDIGMMTFNDCIKIMGRSKDTIVLASGENVEPVPIEDRLLQSALIDHIMLVGQDQKHMAALIVPSLNGLEAKGIKLNDVSEAVDNEQVKQLLAKEIKIEISGENGFKSFERVHDLRILGKPFEVGDELTNKFTMKRAVITDKYENLIGEIYK